VRIADRHERGGRVYIPTRFESVDMQTLRLPTRVAPFGSTRRLFDDVCRVFTNFNDCPENTISALALFSFGAWLADCVPIAPSICIVAGPIAPSGLLLDLLRLAAAGCLLPYLSCLPRKPKNLLVCEPEGFGLYGRVFDNGFGGTLYFFGLRLPAELPHGVTIREWEFRSPWPHFVTWGFALRYVPQSERARHMDTANSELMDVLENERR
jgi:hypothetical protein